MTLESLLALFVLLAISCLTYFAAARFKVPYSVLLVAVGLALVPLTKVSGFTFLDDFKLTPELLFYLFLPILIFESAYNVKLKNLQENIYSISFLAIVSLLISAIIIALGLHFILQFFGFDMPFIVPLLFGALISATDPVAVLALFKEYGAPRRLSLIFEGESLFNDGTAVALFLVLLEVAFKGYHGVSTVTEGVILFSSMVAGGIIFGLLMGLLFSKLIEATRKNENVSIILMLVLAHLTFILAELASHHLVIAGQEFKISAIIATTIASIVMGNYGRYKVSPYAEEFVDKFWAQFAFMVNSLVFILMGLLFAALPFSIFELITPIAIAVLIVATARALSVYPVVGFLNLLKKEEHIPASWQNLLAWGSLRGALAITMVLMIPADWKPEGWHYAHSPQDFIMGLTIGCIYVTLFIKATTIGLMIKKMGLDALTEVEKIEYRDASAYIKTHVTERLKKLNDKGYVDQVSFEKTCKKLEAIYDAAQTRFKISGQHNLAQIALNIHALGIERYYLHEMLMHGEINDHIMRRIQAMISQQLEILESGESLNEHPGSVKGDWLDMLTGYFRTLMMKDSEEYAIDMYLYYRAKAIITRKVTKEMTQFSEDNIKLFNPEDVKPIIDRYKAYQKDAEAKVTALLEKNGMTLEKVKQSLTTLAAEKHQHQLLEQLLHRDLITPKVYVSLRSQLDLPK